MKYGPGRCPYEKDRPCLIVWLARVERAKMNSGGKSSRSSWIVVLLILGGMLSLGAIVKVMFGGLGDVKENVTAVRERATRGSGDLLKRAMRSYLLKTKQEVHMARTTLVRQPDDIGKANLDLGIAKIVLDKALALSPDAKVSDKLTKTKSDIDLAIAQMAISTKGALKILDRVDSEIEALMEEMTSAGPPDTLRPMRAR